MPTRTEVESVPGTVVVRSGTRERRLGRGGRHVEVTVHDPRAWHGLARGSVGLAEGYRRGWWDCDDLTGLVRLLSRATEPVRRPLDALVAAAAPIVDPVARLRRRDRAEDRRNIHAHYDIGNDFYALMLDETMTYSCAVFEHPGQSLADAQRAKLSAVCRRLGLGAGDRVVEIGSGWGGFAVTAATSYDCEVTTTTISAAQHTYVSKLVADAGLADRVIVLDDHYRDLAGTFDHLVSIEMIEAVDWRDHDAYFGTCARLLRPGGTALIQAIVIDDASFERAKHHDDFIRRRIFPGGCLPSQRVIETLARRSGLDVVGVSDIGEHYPETLRRWRANVHHHAEQVARLGWDTGAMREWDMYLAYCEAAFLERHITDVQVVLRRPAG